MIHGRQNNTPARLQNHEPLHFVLLAGSAFHLLW